MSNYCSEIEKLELNLKLELDKYLDLRKIIDKDTRERPEKEVNMLNHSREADFYKDKINQFDIDTLDATLSETKILALEVKKKRDKLGKLHEALGQFGDLEPDNEAIKARIEELKNKRLSLEMSFVENT